MICPLCKKPMHQPKIKFNEEVQKKVCTGCQKLYNKENEKFPSSRINKNREKFLK